MNEQKQETAEGLEPSNTMDDFMFHAVNYVYVRKKLFGSIAAAIVAIILTVYAVIWYMDHQDNKRNEALFRIEKVMHDNELDTESKSDQVIPKLSEFISSHADTRQGRIALFYRSSLYYQQKNYSEAEKDLRQLLGKTEKGSGIQILAGIYLANILKDDNKLSDAINTLQGLKGKAMTDIVLMELAESYISIGEDKKAIETLQTITREHPQSLYRGRADQLLSLLQ